MQSAREKEGVILGRQGDMCTIHAAYVALLHELFEVVYAFRLISEREISAVAGDATLRTYPGVRGGEERNP
eukprot:1231957-Rhodomonas_salina.1